MLRDLENRKQTSQAESNNDKTSLHIFDDGEQVMIADCSDSSEDNEVAEVNEGNNTELSEEVEVDFED